jgi:hypothetical protein
MRAAATDPNMPITSNPLGSVRAVVSRLVDCIESAMTLITRGTPNDAIAKKNSGEKD